MKGKQNFQNSKGRQAEEKRNNLDSNNRQNIDNMNLEISSEFDANITQEEKRDGTNLRNLANRAEKKKSESRR